MNCPIHKAMICFGEFSGIKIWRCITGRYSIVGGRESMETCKEVWQMEDKQIEVEPHTYLKSSRGQEYFNKLAGR